jgi:hypothetical protein
LSRLSVRDRTSHSDTRCALRQASRSARKSPTPTRIPRAASSASAPTVRRSLSFLARSLTRAYAFAHLWCASAHINTNFELVSLPRLHALPLLPLLPLPMSSPYLIICSFARLLRPQVLTLRGPGLREDGSWDLELGKGDTGFLSMRISAPEISENTKDGCVTMRDMILAPFSVILSPPSLPRPPLLHCPSAHSWSILCVCRGECILGGAALVHVYFTRACMHRRHAHARHAVGHRTAPNLQWCTCAHACLQVQRGGSAGLHFIS